jgi:S1-C subfamily serine protease
VTESRPPIKWANVDPSPEPRPAIDAMTPPPPAPLASTSSRGRSWRRPLGAAALVIAIGAAALAMRHDSPPASALDKTAVNKLIDQNVSKAIKDLESAPAHSATVYNTILPSLVVIRSERGGTGDDSSGLGTGVVINDQGAILTALHVVANATALKVSFADGTESPASIQSSDPANDTAVLTAQTPPEVIVPAVLGGGVRVGDEAFAVGHPLGLIASLSSGVISGLGRSIPTETGGTLHNLIQFDAAVNPGNSGGPLLNRNGQVVGIVTALADPSKNGYFIGIGFAVPIATAGGAAGAPPQ